VGLRRQPSTPGSSSFAAQVAAIALAAVCGVLVGLLPPALLDATRDGSSPGTAGMRMAGAVGILALVSWLLRLILRTRAEHFVERARSIALAASVRLPLPAQHALRLDLPLRLDRLLSTLARAEKAPPLAAGAAAAAVAALVALADTSLELLLIGLLAFAASVAIAVVHVGATPGTGRGSGNTLLGTTLSASPATPASPQLALAAEAQFGRESRAQRRTAVHEAQTSFALGLVLTAAVGLAVARALPERTSAEVLVAVIELFLLVGAGLLLAPAVLTQRDAAAASAQLAQLLGVRLGSATALATPTLRGAVSLRGVGATAGEGGATAVLSNFSLEIAPGERIGILTPPGPAAAVLAGLIGKLLEPEEGTVELDGFDVIALAPAAVWRQVALVPAEAALLPGTLLDNVTLGLRESSPGNALAAAEASGLDELARRLPSGYNTWVGSHSWTRGELRRLAIARAIAVDPAVVIVHDAPPGLDPGSERLLAAALDKLARGRTTIVLAERPSSLRGSEAIVVVEGGAVRERTTYDELLGGILAPGATRSLTSDLQPSA